jgi:hypothetical protein
MSLSVSKQRRVDICLSFRKIANRCWSDRLLRKLKTIRTMQWPSKRIIRIVSCSTTDNYRIIFPMDNEIISWQWHVQREIRNVGIVHVYCAFRCSLLSIVVVRLCCDHHGWWWSRQSRSAWERYWQRSANHLDSGRWSSMSDRRFSRSRLSHD